MTADYAGRKNPADTPDDSVSLKAAAKHFKVSTETVRNWMKDRGMPFYKGEDRNDRVWISITEMSQWVRDMKREIKHGGDRRSPAAIARRTGGEAAAQHLTTIEAQHAEAKLRKDLAAAQKAEIELARLEEKLLDAEDVKRGQLERIAHARAVLMGIPASVAPDLVDLQAPEIEAMLRDQIHLALMALSKEDIDDDEL